MESRIALVRPIRQRLLGDKLRQLAATPRPSALRPGQFRGESGCAGVVDIKRAVEEGLLSIAQCWTFWKQRNPEETIATGQEKVLFHLTALETRRPQYRELDHLEGRDADLCEEMI